MSTSPVAKRIGDVLDLLTIVRNLNNAVFMAADSLNDMSQRNAFHSVIDEINNKLLVVDERLEEIGEELK